MSTTLTSMTSAGGPAKPDTRLDYGRRIERVAAHIPAHLDDPLDLERLSEIACFSPYHFHRIYRAMTGETVADTLRRQRLHRAAGELVQGRGTGITGIARRAGYGSVAAFTRAFTQVYGVPPAAYRRRGHLTPFAWPHTRTEDAMQTVTIENQPALHLTGFDHRGPYMEISAAFDRMLAWAAGRGLIGPGARSAAIYYDDPESVAPEALRSFAGLVTAPDRIADGGARSVTLPAGRYAVLVHKGPYAELGGVYRRLYRDWLPASGHVPADQPCYEEYLNDPRGLPPEEWLTRICVPLG
ncbi:AraC family transcriptional regulator [Azospirillum agricola]|uniref:AraC family transcriptional regulator n=1 Tax=Azospirillum agricola TaxID=1720247 RepID=UPI001AE35253|nr:AraC family transcriptional regulator [Azospirillum agricola]MBP2232339.1 AraC family transcriptional regulator [Azospirillum agricola]